VGCGHHPQRRHGGGDLMAIRNPRFEDAGAQPGSAAHWTLVTFVAAERVAAFGPAPVRGWEDFERWTELKLAFAAGDLALGLFDALPEGREDFDEAWDNDLYLRAWSAGHSEACVFDGAPLERFDHGWATDTFVDDWSALADAAGVFDGQPREDFEDAWLGNHAFLWTWSTVTSVAAVFAPGLMTGEGFEVGWPMATTT
ncbi:MAG: hypothetical protein ACTHU0_20425, partial [Kofleriaceae bacterium]